MVQWCKSQRGDSKVITAILVVAGILFVLGLWKIGYPTLQYLRLTSYVERAVNYDRENTTLDYGMMRSLHDKLVNQAEKLGVPVDDRDIFIDRELDRVTIKLKYSVPVDLFVYKFDMKFKINKTSEGLGFKK